MRRAELRQAHRARRSSRPRRAADGRPREDRLSGRTQAASLGRASHRHDALSARFGVALLARARLRRVGRSARNVRPRPAAHAERRGVLQPDAEDARSPRLHHQQRVPDRAPAAGVLRAHDGRGDGRAEGHARAHAEAARRVRAVRRSRPRARAEAVAGAAARRRARVAEARCFRQGCSIRICSRSICAAATPGACCSTRSRPSSCSKCSSSTRSRRSSSTRA